MDSCSMRAHLSFMLAKNPLLLFLKKCWTKNIVFSNKLNQINYITSPAPAPPTCCHLNTTKRTWFFVKHWYQIAFCSKSASVFIFFTTDVMHHCLICETLTNFCFYIKSEKPTCTCQKVIQQNNSLQVWPVSAKMITVPLFFFFLPWLIFLLLLLCMHQSRHCS